MSRGKAIVFLSIIILSAIAIYSIKPVYLREYWNEIFSGKEGSGLEGIEKLLSASSGHVYFLYPVSARSDYISRNIVYNMCKRHPQIEHFFELNDAMVDSDGSPRLSAIGEGEFIVLFGGPNGNDCVRYYEETDQTSAIFKGNDTHIWWETRNGETVNNTFTSTSELDEHHDIFIIEYFYDVEGRCVFICYGYGWRGTWAAVLYFRDVIYPNLSTYSQPYYVFTWVDTNDDTFPDVNEVMEERPKYVSIQATLHSKADPALLRWFSDACHSRGLKVTWYVNPLDLDDTIISLLNNYTSVGDDVELSFGSIFFNDLEPEDRLGHVDQCIVTFKQEFDYDPLLVESHYIDAYTLNYISLRFPSIIGGVSYVNHEVYLDDFKSTGAYYMPYYPSKYNALVPGIGQDKINFTMLPFIHRDITNCMLSQSNLLGLNPQDSYYLINNWWSYFGELFQAYIKGWDQFGLAFYLIDLTYPVIPKEVVETDLDYIQAQIQSEECSNVLDKDFVTWFKSKFKESPSYRWIYKNPMNESSVSEWYFSTDLRRGYVDGQLLDIRTYNDNREECYNKRIFVYDNSIPSDTR